jgi:antitoxin YefM
MSIVTFTELRKNLKQVMEQSIDQHEPVIIMRPRGEHVIMLSLKDYESLKETAYLLGNAANAKHLRKSLNSVKKGKLLARELHEE